MLNTLSAHGSLLARILLIADTAVGMRVRTALLKDFGCEVTAVRGAVQGLRLLCSDAFDLVVTDCKVPDGIGLIERSRENQANIPIVLISGFDEANTGADVVIQKSCHEDSALRRASVGSHAGFHNASYQRSHIIRKCRQPR